MEVQMTRYILMILFTFLSSAILASAIRLLAPRQEGLNISPADSQTAQPKPGLENLAGTGSFTSPRGGETWYVGERRTISWETERIDINRLGDESTGLTTGWSLYRYPDRYYVRTADYDPEDRLWNLTETSGSNEWTVTNSCLGSRCYFKFHYFKPSTALDTGRYVSINSEEFTVLPQATTGTSGAPTATVTVFKGTDEERIIKNSGVSKSDAKVVVPIVLVVIFVGAAVAGFYWRKQKKVESAPNMPPPPGYASYDNSLYAAPVAPDSIYHMSRSPSGLRQEAGGTERKHELDGSKIYEISPGVERQV